MVASIREFGFAVPVLAKSDGECIDGHLRAKAAAKMGMAEVPVIPCDGWTDAQVKAFRLMVNRSVGWAEWDDELLGLELGDLKALDFDLSLTGFDPRELDQLLLPAASLEEDAVPEVPAEPVSRLGDLWLCGKHRVMCGDCRDTPAILRLLGPGMAYPGNRLPTFTASHDATGHAAAFPVGLPEFFIKAFTDEGDRVCDPFAGSGSTLIAAERTGRACTSIEISPGYVDVIVQRWQNQTNQQATLDGDGRTFTQVAESRVGQPIEEPVLA